MSVVLTFVCGDRAVDSTTASATVAVTCHIARCACLDAGNHGLTEQLVW